LFLTPAALAAYLASLPAELASRSAELVRVRLLQERQESELLALRNTITTNAMSASASAARIGELADGAVKRLRGWNAATDEPSPGSARPGSARGGGSGVMVLSVVDSVVLEQLEGCGVDVARLRTAAKEAAESDQVGGGAAGAAAQTVRPAIAAWLAVLMRGALAYGAHMFWQRAALTLASMCGVTDVAAALLAQADRVGVAGGCDSAHPAELPAERRVGCWWRRGGGGECNLECRGECNGE
jgi:hypothetical protein